MISNNTLKVTKKTIADLSFHAGLLKKKLLVQYVVITKIYFETSRYIACITFYFVCE